MFDPKYNPNGANWREVLPRAFDEESFISLPIEDWFEKSRVDSKPAVEDVERAVKSELFYEKGGFVIPKQELASAAFLAERIARYKVEANWHEPQTLAFELDRIQSFCVHNNPTSIYWLT